jgi:signal transduction histidine kinase
VRFAWRWRAERNPVDGTLAFVAFWQGLASISMHNFPLWNASWWMYHYILLLGFLITIVVLVREYEHARQFNLLRYYLAISLIFTALLALIASDLFVRNAFETLAAELEAHARARIGEFTTGVTNTINPGTAGGDALAIHVDALRTIPALAVLVFDDKAHLVYPLTGDYGAAPAFSEEESDEFSRQETGAAQEVPVPPGSMDGYEAALAGETLIAIREPGNAPEGYAPAESVHTLETFAPLYAVPEEARLPIGVVQLVEEAPELTHASLRARVSSLGITTLTMTVLFTALLLVVRRADRILTTRTNQLNQAFNDLRTSERLRDDLTKMIVHDLRNPLSAISASVDLLKMTSADGHTEQQAQFTNMAKEATRRMSGLVDDILTVSRYEAGELTLELREASLPDLIERHIAGFRPQADAEEKSITVRCPPDLRARIDTALFGRVIENLVSNALKYVPSGEGKIEVIASPTERRVSFHVLDNGEGIPDEYKSQIFQKYVQVPDERRAVRKGTGLGLAFCRMVIESHGGKIWVQDAPGGGSDFVFWVPV